MVFCIVREIIIFKCNFLNNEQIVGLIFGAIYLDTNFNLLYVHIHKYFIYTMDISINELN